MDDDDTRLPPTSSSNKPCGRSGGQCPALSGNGRTLGNLLETKEEKRENLMFLSLRVAAAARFKERMREHKRYGRVEKERAHKAGTRLTTGLSLLIGAFTKERFISLFSFSSLYLLLCLLIPTDKLGF